MKRYFKLSLVFLSILFLIGCDNNDLSKDTSELKGEIEDLSNKVDEYKNSFIEEFNKFQKEVDILNAQGEDINKELILATEKNLELEERIVKQETEINGLIEQMEIYIDIVKQIDIISPDDAINLVKEYIKTNSISIPYPEYNMHLFQTTKPEGYNYHIIRIYYTDPNNKANTETISRYWVNKITGKILKEDLWTGELIDEMLLE